MKLFIYDSLKKINIQSVVILLSLLLLSSISFSQNYPDPILNPNRTASFYTIQKAMNDYWDQQNVKGGYVLENGGEKKVPNWKLYKRWEYFWEQRVNQTTGEFPTTNSIAEYQKYLSTHNSLNKVNYDESWTNLGTNSSTGGYAGIGRINCIAFHPSDLNIFWVGSPSGGIWKTTTGGNNWTILNNNELVLGVSNIVIPSDYATSNTIYIATGDRDGGSSSLSGGQASDNVSIGVLKSTDGGSTWNTTGLSFTKNSGNKLTRLLIHPSNNQILFAAVWSSSDANQTGIYKTTDGGVTWGRKSVNQWIDMEFKPGDPTIIYASSPNSNGTYIARSSDSGESWPFGSGPVVADGRRGELAVSPADPNLVYLIAANTTRGVEGVYKSTDSGLSFTKVNSNSSTEPGMLGYYTDGRGPATGQCSYDLCIAVDPVNADVVYIGGITTWKSTDGGINWFAINNWTSSTTYNTSGAPVVHADKHALDFQGNSTLFEGNDGGIYKTTNGGISWTDLSNGLVISQIYRIGVSQTNANKIITGLQDNGSKLYNTGFWSDVTGGDGMECIVDYSDANYMYATYVTGQIRRSTNGSTFPTAYITANIPGGQPTGAWVTPYLIDPSNSATLIAGFDQVWKTTNRGDSWTSVSQVLSATNKLRSLAIAPSNSQILYAADQTHMWKTTDGGATDWTSVTLPSSTNYLTYIAIKNSDPNTLWITYGGYTDGSKVYESTDGGGSWSNISAGLPNLPVMSIVYYKEATDRNVLFVGTDVGVYVKNGTNNWEQFNTGLPNVLVSEIEILYTGGTDKLRAGTYGRGLWETNIDAALPVELVSFTSSVKNNSIMLNWSTATEVNNFGFEVERSVVSDDVTNLSWEKIGFVNGSGNSNSTKNYVYEDKNINSGKYSYRLKQIDNDGQYSYSGIIEVDFGIPKEFVLSQNYPNPFNPITTIRYQIPKDNKVVIKIYNILGAEVMELVNEQREAGIYEAEFNASKLSSGTYFYKITAGNFVSTKKMVLLK